MSTSKTRRTLRTLESLAPTPETTYPDGELDVIPDPFTGREMLAHVWRRDADGTPHYEVNMSKKPLRITLPKEEV